MLMRELYPRFVYEDVSFQSSSKLVVDTVYREKYRFVMFLGSL